MIVTLLILLVEVGCSPILATIGTHVDAFNLPPTTRLCPALDVFIECMVSVDSPKN
jgi:hypothetical protein